MEKMFNEYFAAFWPIVKAGSALILVNVLLHYLREKITSALKDRVKLKDLLSRANVPIKRRADDLISRLSNLLIGWADPKEIEKLKTQLSDKEKWDARLQQLTPSEMTWTETTAFRILELFWAIQQFRCETRLFINIPDIEGLEYFLNDKLTMPMRGKIYYSTFFSREDEEELYLFFPEAMTSANGPTLKDLTKILKEDSEKRRLYSMTVAYLCLGKQGFDDICAGEINSPSARKMASIAHFSIYLIDIFQGLGNTPKWEEYRVFFVRILQQVNRDRETTVHLYYKKDLEQKSYILTYPEEVIRRTFLFSWLTKFHLKPFCIIRRYAFQITLWWRARRHLNRHHKKRIDCNGVSIKADDVDYHIKLAESISNVKEQLTFYLKQTGRRVPYKLGENS